MAREGLDGWTLAGLGWTAQTGLTEEIVSTYAWFVEAAERGGLRV